MQCSANGRIGYVASINCETAEVTFCDDGIASAGAETVKKQQLFCVPDEDQIRRQCEAFQATWNISQERRHRGLLCLRDEDGYTIPGGMNFDPLDGMRRAKR